MAGVKLSMEKGVIILLVLAIVYSIAFAANNALSPSPNEDDNIPPCWNKIINCWNESVSDPDFMSSTLSSLNVSKTFCCSTVLEVVKNEGQCFCPWLPQVNSADPGFSSRFDLYLSLCNSTGCLSTFCSGSPTVSGSKSPSSSGINSSNIVDSTLTGLVLLLVTLMFF